MNQDQDRPSPWKRLWSNPAPSVLFGVLALIFCAEVATNYIPLGRLEEHYTDHIRHFRMVQAFGAEGFNIYRHPFSEVEHYGDPRCYAWGSIGYVYPPGSLAFFAPFSILYYNLGTSLELASRLSLMALVLVHHLGCCILATSILESTAGFIFLALYYVIGLFWALNGQHEVVALLFIFLGSAYQDRPALRRNLFCLAAFVKFQFLISAPFVLRSAMEQYKKGGRSALLSPSNIPGLLLLTICAVLLWTCKRYLAPEIGNPLSWAELANGSGRPLLCLLTTGIFSGIFLARKKYFMAAIHAANYWAYASLAIFQDWYLLILFSIPAMAKRGTERELAIAYVLIFCYFFGAMSDPWRPLYLLLEAFHL